MSNVREVVIEAMQEHGMAGYVNQAGPVLDVLVERDSDIADSLIEAGVGLGAPEERVRSLMIEVGLLPAPLVAVSSNGNTESAEGGDDVMGMLRSIQSSIEGLTTFARANGYRG